MRNRQNTVVGGAVVLAVALVLSACGRAGQEPLAPLPATGKADNAAPGPVCSGAEDTVFQVPVVLDWQGLVAAIDATRAALSNTDAANAPHLVFKKQSGEACFDAIVAKEAEGVPPLTGQEAIDSFELEQELVQIQAELQKGLDGGGIRKIALLDLSAPDDFDIELYLLDDLGQVHALTLYFDCEDEELDSGTAWVPTDRRLCK